MTTSRRPQGPVFVNRRLRWQEVAPPDQSRGRPDLLALRCWHCGTVGMLTDSWVPEDKTCPGCHEDRLVATASWIT
jgi:hypothetical protein